MVSTSFFLPENKTQDFWYQNPMLAKLKDKSFISCFVGSDISLSGSFIETQSVSVLFYSPPKLPKAI